MVCCIEYDHCFVLSCIVNECFELLFCRGCTRRVVRAAQVYQIDLLFWKGRKEAVMLSARHVYYVFVFGILHMASAPGNDIAINIYGICGILDCDYVF